MTSGNLKKGEMEHVPFNLFIQATRRKQLLNAIMGKGEDKRTGKRIFTNFKQQVKERGETPQPNFKKEGKKLIQGHDIEIL